MAIECESLVDPTLAHHQKRNGIDETQIANAALENDVETTFVQIAPDPDDFEQRSEVLPEGCHGVEPHSAREQRVCLD